MNKKLIFAVVGIAVLLVGGIFVAKKMGQPATGDNLEEEQSIPDLPSDQRPVVALVPTTDGHYLGLKIEQINKVKGANSLDYELTWKAINGGNQTTQGTSGTVKLDGGSSYNKDLLLGSESNGKFRYDQGVEVGAITLQFRNSSGKLLGKVKTGWHMQSNTTTLTSIDSDSLSVDNKFKYTLDKAVNGVYFMTMQSFGKPNSTSVVVNSGDYSIFASDGKPHSGK